MSWVSSWTFLGCSLVPDGDVFCSPCRYDTYKLQRLHQKKLDRQEAIVEKEMFVGKMMHSGEMYLQTNNLKKTH